MMSEFNLIKSVTNLLVEGCKMEDEESAPIDHSVLSDEEVERLADFIHYDLVDDVDQDELVPVDTDRVTEKAYEFVEDIPGLEMPETQQAAVKLIVAKYFAKYPK